MDLEKQYLLDDICNVKIPFTMISTFSLPDHSLLDNIFLTYGILWMIMFIYIVNCFPLLEK